MRRILPLVVVLVAGRAAADTAKHQAAQLFQAGRDLARAGKYAEACDTFAQSFLLDPAPGTVLNLGDCHEHLGHLAEAWRRFDHAAAQFDLAHDDGRAKFARTRRDALGPRLGIVVVLGAGPGEHVTVAGREVAVAPQIIEHVDPGEVEIRAGDRVRHEHVAAGGTVVVNLTTPAPVAAPPASPAAPAAAIATTVPGPRAPGRVHAAYALWLGGGVAVTTSFVLGWLANAEYSDQIDAHRCTQTGGQLVCNPEGNAQVQAALNLADVATGVGVAALVLGATGTVLYFTAPHERVVVTPTASPTAAGISVSGSF